MLQSEYKMPRLHKKSTMHDAHSKVRQFDQGDHVLVRNYVGTPRWLPGHITLVLGPVSYQVTLDDGRQWRRHQYQQLMQ